MSPRLRHEHRVLLLVAMAGAPALVLALGLLWTGEYSARLQWTVTLLVVVWLLGFLGAVRERVVYPLQTLSNLIAALAEGDFSLRARRAWSDDALGLAFWEVNHLTELLRGQRIDAVEATALLATVMEEIDVAVLAFDGEEQLRLVNRAGARLLGAEGNTLLGRTAWSLGLRDALEGPTPRIVDLPFAPGRGRWELRRCTFRQEGRPHELVVLSDLSRTLREEERQAWRRLVRVLSHEINNSLAPIRSLSQSLLEQLRRGEPQDDLVSDLARGLETIGGRAEALVRFMRSYARLAHLPAPTRRPVPLDEWVRRIAKLETRMDVEIVGGPAVTVQADADQLDQVLINLLGNAVDAALETGGAVRVGWGRTDSQADVWVEDDGPGLADTANLFVPFYTTKTMGSGIGLVLSRQIAEGHGGSLTLENRAGARGCIARLRLPA